MENEDKLQDSQLNNTLSGLSENVQNKVLEHVEEQEKKKGGFIGRIIGTNPMNSILNISFVVLLILLLILVVDFVVEVIVRQGPMNSGVINLFVPVITLIMGYLFGKNR